MQLSSPYVTYPRAEKMDHFELQVVEVVEEDSADEYEVVEVVECSSSDESCDVDYDPTSRLPVMWQSLLHELEDAKAQVSALTQHAHASSDATQSVLAICLATPDDVDREIVD